MDAHAICVAERTKEHNSFTELVNELTAGCLSELEKVRAIFRWREGAREEGRERGGRAILV